MIYIVLGVFLVGDDKPLAQGYIYQISMDVVAHCIRRCTVVVAWQLKLQLQLTIAINLILNDIVGCRFVLVQVFA